DASGTKITPPTGFTQGKQTIIDKDNFTFTQAGTLPFMYKVNNRPYVLKGWYKGKEKPDKLNEITRTNRNISYPVTYDDQDDITIVYDEFKTEDKTINFGFINETGDYVAPSNFNIRTDMSQVVGGLQSKLQTITALPTGDFLQLKLPAVNIVGSFTSDEELYGTRNSIVTIPKYYKTPTITPSSKYNGPNYSGVTGIIAYHNTKNSAEFTENRLQVTPISGSQTDYRFPEVGWQGETTRTTFSSLYKMDYNSTVSGVTAHTEIYATGTVN
ncbi:WxL domain-containing protein, partial [Escherichia coli]|nr:WxL domain-containing protein [Escherichia coli]